MYILICNIISYELTLVVSGAESGERMRLLQEVVSNPLVWSAYNIVICIGNQIQRLYCELFPESLVFVTNNTE